jgi:hypothetical protein
MFQGPSAPHPFADAQGRSGRDDRRGRSVGSGQAERLGYNLRVLTIAIFILPVVILIAAVILAWPRKEE